METKSPQPTSTDPLLEGCEVSSSDNPPPYAMLDRTMKTLRDEFIVKEDEADEREVQRLRNFMLYTLSCDYQYNMNIKLCADDRNHLASLNSRLGELRSAHLRPAREDRQVLAPYFWRYIHRPSIALGIPVDIIVVAIARFFKYVDTEGGYKGCTFGLAHNFGTDKLAGKIYLDKMITIPTLVPKEHRQKMIVKLEKVSSIYIRDFQGLDSGTSTTAEGGWLNVNKPVYSRTQRGRDYDNDRKDAISRAKGMGGWSTLKNWASEIMECTRKIMHQKKQRLQEQNSTSTKAQTGIIPWTWYQSVYLPDFFHVESRYPCYNGDL